MWRGGETGGDFQFASVGNVILCQHCDVLIYNPTHYHGTTKFSLHKDDVASGRIFMTKNVIHTDLLSQAMTKRISV
jgi:hypothetical protein